MALGQMLTAYSCGGSRGLVPRSCDLGFVPHSLFAPLRETINLVRSRASRHGVVNGCINAALRAGPIAARQSNWKNWPAAVFRT